MATIYLLSLNDPAVKRRDPALGQIFTMTMPATRGLGIGNWDVLAPTPWMVYGHKAQQGDMRWRNHAETLTDAEFDAIVEEMLQTGNVARYVTTLHVPMLSDAQYTVLYHRLLRQRKAGVEQWIAQTRAYGGNLTLCCYCRQGDFCHRRLLAVWFPTTNWFPNHTIVLR